MGARVGIPALKCLPSCFGGGGLKSTHLTCVQRLSAQSVSDPLAQAGAQKTQKTQDPEDTEDSVIQAGCVMGERDGWKWG